jgi:hypothetical protein
MYCIYNTLVLLFMFFFLHFFHFPGQAGCPPFPMSATVSPHFVQSETQKEQESFN